MGTNEENKEDKKYDDYLKGKLAVLKVLEENKDLEEKLIAEGKVDFANAIKAARGGKVN